MFAQLTWSLGMLMQCALLVFGALWLVARVRPLPRAGVFALQGVSVGAGSVRAKHSEAPRSVVRRGFRPDLLAASGLFGLYLVVLGLLWVGGGREDLQALDWGVTVVLLGTLVVGARAGLMTTLGAVFVRAGLVFLESADAVTRASYADGGGGWLDPTFWVAERWVFAEPGVVQLGVAGLAAGVAVAWLAPRPERRPLWVGVPLSLLVTGGYAVAALWQWGPDSAAAYLGREAAPAALGLASAVGLLMLGSRAAAAHALRERAHRAELRAERERLRFLGAQMDPHALSNALNAIAGVSIESPARSRELIAALGAQLRAHASGEAEVTLERELALVRGHVALQRARHGGALDYREDVQPEALTRQLPRMSVQTLVENAIRHGLGPSGRGRVVVGARIENDALVLHVTDDGHGRVDTVPDVESTGGAPSGRGIGLANTNDRLARLYGDGARCELTGLPGVGARATLVVPASHGA